MNMDMETQWKPLNFSLKPGDVLTAKKLKPSHEDGRSCKSAPFSADSKMRATSVPLEVLRAMPKLNLLMIPASSLGDHRKEKSLS